jgi:hypothetical protein
MNVVVQGVQALMQQHNKAILWIMPKPSQNIEITKQIRINYAT